MAFLNSLQTSYNISGNQIQVLPVPFQSESNPTAASWAEIGQVWINTALNTAYICVENVPNAVVWLEITNAGGGAGVFASLVVAPGPVTLNNASAQDVAILDGASSGNITINSDTGTGSVLIGNTAAGAVSLNSGANSNFTVTGAFDLDLTSTLGSINLDAGLSGANAIVLNASGANGEVVIRGGSLGVVIAPDDDSAIVDIANVVPVVARDVIIAGGTLASAVTDSVSIAGGGVNFALSEKFVEIASDATDIGTQQVDVLNANMTLATGTNLLNLSSGSVLLGSNTVNIGAGNAASGTNNVNISTGTGGGTKVVSIGNADGLTSVAVNGIVAINNNTNAAVTINDGTSTGAVTIGSATAGAITLDSAAGISIDAATASNFSAAAGDLTLAAATNSVVISAAEAVADGIQLTAVGGVQVSAAAANGITFTNGAQTAQILVGTGSPNGAVTGLQGSIFLNVAGAANTILYVNTDGAMAWSALS